VQQFTEQQANEIFDMLVKECGSNESLRENFVYSILDGCREYRFGGDLGFGGKFRNNGNGVYVDCYQENANSERNGIK